MKSQEGIKFSLSGNTFISVRSVEESDIALMAINTGETVLLLKLIQGAFRLYPALSSFSLLIL